MITAIGVFIDAIPSSSVNRMAADDNAIYWTDQTNIGSVPLP